ncbi:hypothetical protein ABZ330_17890 [Streptomyces sp. NPDC006172]|uniref:hypothetical protein n=1 Tax=Streptomyces sp. NPDC006172 TaxID=3154470 RepID=UPI0033CA281E
MISPNLRSGAPLSPAAADVLRIVNDSGTPVFVTVHADGRRRYSYWQPLDARTGRGGCYTALPTAECDQLHSAGRIALGEPLTDPTRTIYRVRPTRTPAPPARAARAAAARPAARPRAERGRLWAA